MKTRITLSALVFMFVFTSQAQTLGEFNVKTSEMGKRNLRSAPRKVYIASFNVYFEIYKEAVDFKKGGSMLGGGVRGSATARAAVGLSGIDTKDIQEKTNQLYNEFVTDLKNGGLEIISPDVAGKIKTYSDWEKATGPFVAESGIAGTLISVPEGHSQYFRGMKANGKVKKGMLDDNLLPARISSQLDDAIIANVNLYFMFADEKSNVFNGNAAKVKILTNLRLVGDFTIRSSNANEKGFLKGQESLSKVSSAVIFNQGKQGLGSPVTFASTLKNPLEVDGVIKKEKVTAFQKQGSSTPTSFSSVSLMDTGDKLSKNTTWIEVDSKKYAQGLYMASKKLLDNGTQSLVSNLK